MTDTATIVTERDRKAGLRKARPYLERPLLDDESEQARAILQAHGIAYRRIRTDFATGAHTVIEEWQPPQLTERTDT